MTPIARKTENPEARIQELETALKMRDKRIEVLESFRKHLGCVLDAVFEFEKEYSEIKLTENFKELKAALERYVEIPDERNSKS